MTRLTMAQLPAARARLVAMQKGKCPICGIGITPANAVVDHNHSTGFIRGALCRNCNGIEGKISNLANRGKRTGTVNTFLEALLNYLKLHEYPKTRFKYPLHKTDAEKRELKNKRARMKRQGCKANGHKLTR